MAADRAVGGSGGRSRPGPEPAPLLLPLATFSSLPLLPLWTLVERAERRRRTPRSSPAGRPGGGRRRPPASRRRARPSCPAAARGRSRAGCHVAGRAGMRGARGPPRSRDPPPVIPAGRRVDPEVREHEGRLGIGAREKLSERLLARQEPDSALHLAEDAPATVRWRICRSSATLPTARWRSSTRAPARAPTVRGRAGETSAWSPDEAVALAPHRLDGASSPPIFFRSL